MERFSDPADDATMRSLLANHAVFAERFFDRAVHERIARRFGEARIGLEEFQRLLSEAWGGECRLYDTWEAIWRIQEHLYEQTLMRAINEAEVYHRLEAWFEQSSVPRNCVLCGNPFKLVDLPDWIYFGSNGYRSCCFQCRIVQAPLKGELKSLVPTFVQVCGFIPNSDASPINYAFTSRLPDDRWAEVFLAYAKMGGVEHVKKRYGSWFRALAETSALPHSVLVTARGIRCLAQDGHICHSLDEQRVDDWLFGHGFRHEREPAYPVHPSLNPQGHRRADWSVLDTFIEYFGLVGDSDYEKKMDEKIALAEHLRIRMIALYPSDIETLDQALAGLHDSRTD